MRLTIFVVLLMIANPAGVLAQNDDAESVAAKAQANKTKMKIRPKFKSGPPADFPEEAKLKGEFGKAIVSGIVDEDGRFIDLLIITSSRSKVLDKAALAAAAATLFKPARDDAGVAIAVPVVMPVEFSNAKSPGKGGGVLRYYCGQFALDYDWWYNAWSEDEVDDFYKLVLGFSTLAKSRHGDGSLDYGMFAKVNKDFKIRWKQAVEECRKRPDKLFIDIFQPEGKTMQEIAQAAD